MEIRTVWPEASGQKLADRPDVVRQPPRHRGRDAKRLIDVAEMEMHKKQPAATT